MEGWIPCYYMLYCRTETIRQGYMLRVFGCLDTYGLMLAILFSNLLLPMLSAQQGNKDAIRIIEIWS